MGLRRALLILPLIASVTVASEFRARMDLQKFVDDPAALNTLKIEYLRGDNNIAIFVYGTGKIVRQTLPHPFTSLVPTCQARLDQARVRTIVQALISHHFFDLPQKSYIYMTADDDSVKDLNVHCIILDDGRVNARRDFAYGTFNGKREEVPSDFVAMEKLVQQLADDVIGIKPCTLAPRIQLSPTPPRVPLPPSHAQRQN